MKLFAPLPRAAALCAIVLGAMAAPALAAPADLALLQGYIGSWRGKGELVGAEKEAVICRMSVLQGQGDKINYAGRCSFAGTQLSVNGTIAYNDAGRQYEAAMTTNVGFTGTAVGRKSGSGVVFNLKEQDKDTEGNDITVSSTITLSGPQISVDFNVLFNKTGDTITAQVPFTKG